MIIPPSRFFQLEQQKQMHRKQGIVLGTQKLKTHFLDDFNKLPARQPKTTSQFPPMRGMFTFQWPFLQGFDIDMSAPQTIRDEIETWILGRRREKEKENHPPL